MGDLSQIFSALALLIFFTTVPFLTYWVTFRYKALDTALKAAQSKLSENPELVESAWLAKKTHRRVGWALGILWAISPMVFVISGPNLGEESFAFYGFVFLVSFFLTMVLLSIFFFIDGKATVHHYQDKA